MTILYPTPRRVKPSTFGRGLLASRPVVRVEHTSEDELWWAQHNGSPAFVPDFDAMAAEAAAMDSLEAGYCM